MRPFYSLLASALLSCCSWLCAAAQQLDPNFAPSVLTSPAGGMQTLLKQPDGKVLISGNFQLMNGSPSPRLARLNADGSPDLTFRAQAGAGPNGSISALAVQADGKILVGAEYGLTSYNGTPVQNLSRLNADGSLDGAFSSGGTGWLGGEIRSIAVQADGKILVGGLLSATFNGQPTKGLIRLLPTGQPDASFATGAGFVGQANGYGEVRKIIIQPDGNIVAAGNFGTVGGQPSSGIARLTPTGSLDLSFSSFLTASAYVLDAMRQPDGKLVVGGALLTSAGNSSNNLVRLLPNGALDATFVATQNQGAILSVGLRSDGSILVAGIFTSFGSLPRGGLVRLSSTGAVDATFAAGAGTTGTITSLVELNNGQYLTGGYFDQFDGQNDNSLVRLQSNGQLDASYSLRLDFVMSGPLVPLANGQAVLVSYQLVSFNGQPVVSSVGLNYPQLHLINADGTYNAPLVFPAITPRPTGGTYYRDISPQPDGTAYAAYQNTDSTMLVRRILANGTFDPAYAAAVLQFGTSVQFPLCCGGVSLTPVAGGQLLVRGTFGRVNGQPRRYLARLQADGTLNTSFAPPTNAAWQVPSVGVGNTAGFRHAVGLANGQTLVLWNDATRSYVARLNLDGTTDNTFSIGAGGGASSVFSMVPLASGKLLVNGNFTTFGGQAAPNGLVRLLASGAADPGFAAASAARNVVEQPDSKLVVVAPGANQQIERVIRLNADGSLDNGFQPVPILNTTFLAADATVYLQPASNGLLLSGNFTSVAGQPRFGLARLVNTPLAVRGAGTAPLAAVFPNPAHEQLSLRLPTPPTGPVLLADLQGRAVRRWPLAQASGILPLAGLAPGLYLLGITTAAGTSWQRLAIE